MSNKQLTVIVARADSVEGAGQEGGAGSSPEVLRLLG